MPDYILIEYSKPLPDGVTLRDNRVAWDGEGQDKTVHPDQLHQPLDEICRAHGAIPLGGAGGYIFPEFGVHHEVDPEGTIKATIQMPEGVTSATLDRVKTAYTLLLGKPSETEVTVEHQPVP